MSEKVTIFYPARQDVVDWLINWIANELEILSDEIDSAQSVLDYSLSSVTATILVGDLEDWIDLRLPPTLVWDYPSIDDMTDFVMAKVKEKGSVTNNDDSVVGVASTSVPTKDANELLENLDELSEEEVDALLRQLASSDEAPA